MISQKTLDAFAALKLDIEADAAPLDAPHAMIAGIDELVGGFNDATAANSGAPDAGTLAGAALLTVVQQKLEPLRQALGLPAAPALTVAADPATVAGILAALPQ